MPCGPDRRTEFPLDTFQIVGVPGGRILNPPPTNLDDPDVPNPLCLLLLEGRDEEPVGPERVLVSGPPPFGSRAPWHTHTVTTFARSIGKVNACTNTVMLMCPGFSMPLYHFHCVVDGIIQSMYLAIASNTGSDQFDSGAIGALHSHSLHWV